MRALLGIAIALASVAAFAAIEERSRGTELTVELRARAAGRGDRTGSVPPAIADRVQVRAEPDAPGLRRTRWRVEYRGGHVREVGATALVGPAQAAGACTGRVVVGQKLLDQLAPIVARLAEQELAGVHVVGLGDVERVDQVALRWADHAIRATATVELDRAHVPLEITFEPVHEGDTLHFRVAMHAELRFGNRAMDWLSEKLHADQLATRIANRELDAALVTALAPPPPIELGDGQTLRFAYCDAPIEIHDGAWGVLPFAVVFEGGAPVHFAAGPRTEPRADTLLALDLDLDALDAMLFELWRTKWLDRRLADAGLDRAFAADPTVAQFLSVRIGAPVLALPPVIEPAGDHLRLAADARVPIRDGALVTTGRVFGALDLRFPASVALAPLELACERSPTTLVPCYGDLVAGLAAHADDFDGALAQRFTELVRAIFEDRELATGDVPVRLHVRGATLSLGPAARSVHVELDAELQ